MKPVVMRFALMAALFCGWLGYLFYLYLHLPVSPNGLPPILSRSQFLVSDLDVAADIEDGTVPLGDLLAASAGVGAAQAIGDPHEAHAVKVRDVLYPPNSALKAGAVLYVTNFSMCVLPAKEVPGKPTPPPPLPTPLSGLGPVLLPLRTFDGGMTWRVAPLPPSPTFGGQAPRIYPDDKETRAQHRQIAK